MDNAATIVFRVDGHLGCKLLCTIPRKGEDECWLWPSCIKSHLSLRWNDWHVGNVQ